MADSPPRPPDSERHQRAVRLAGDALAHFRAGLHRFLIRRLRGAQDVEDLAQEVYLRLLRAGGRTAVENPQAYVYRVASNVLYEFKFHRRRRHVVFDSDTVDAALGGLEDEMPPPEAVYEQQRLEQRLAATVALLSPMQRAVFLLAKHQDLSHAQIAERLGISINTARVHLQRAITQCRRAMLGETP